MLAASVLLVGVVGVTTRSADTVLLTVIQDSVEELEIDEVERIIGEYAITLCVTANSGPALDIREEELLEYKNNKTAKIRNGIAPIQSLDICSYLAFGAIKEADQSLPKKLGLY